MNCHVCLERFDATQHRPKVLPCGHTYCLPCLQTLHTLPRKECPECRRDFSRSAGNLPDNYTVLRISDRPTEVVPRCPCQDSKREACLHSLPANMLCISLAVVLVSVAAFFVFVDIRSAVNSPFSEPRPNLGTVELSVPMDVIKKLKTDGQQDNIVTYPLPAGIDGRICVHLRPKDSPNSENRKMLEVRVEGLPDNANVVFQADLTWETENYWIHQRKIVSHALGGRASAVWLRGNGCLLMLDYRRPMGIGIVGSVTVYGAPNHEAHPAIKATAVHKEPTKKASSDFSAPSSKTRPDFSTLKNLTALADVTLRAAGKDFPAHRNVLAARSAVLLTMFTSDSKQATNKVVEVAVDCSAEVFGLFLDSLYSGALGKQRCADLIPLLELADHWMVEDLKAQCVRQLLAVEVEEALLVFRATLEKSFIPKEVSAQAGDVIRSNWQTVSSSQEWRAFEEAQPVAAHTLKIVLGGAQLN